MLLIPRRLLPTTLATAFFFSCCYCCCCCCSDECLLFFDCPAPLCSSVRSSGFVASVLKPAQANRVHIARCRGIEHVISAIKTHASHAHVQKFAFGALRNLAVNNGSFLILTFLPSASCSSSSPQADSRADNMSEIGRLGAIDLILAAMRRHEDPKVQGRACGVLFNLAFNDSTPLLSSPLSFLLDPFLRSLCTPALKVGQDNKYRIREKALPLIQNAIISFPNSTSVQSAAPKLLKKLEAWAIPAYTLCDAVPGPAGPTAAVVLPQIYHRISRD